MVNRYPHENKDRLGTVELNLLKGLIKTVTDAPIMQLWLMRMLVNHAVATPDDITRADWEQISKRAYMDYDRGDLRITPAFSAELGELANQYRETMQGQQRLPGF